MIATTDRKLAWRIPSRLARVAGGEVLRSGRGATGFSTDTRTLTEGECFVAIPGDRFDGHDWLEAAIAAGARGLVVERRPDLRNLPRHVFVVQVPDCREALLRFGAEHRRRVGAAVVGITGSNGKTSTKDMLGHVLEAAGPTVRSPASFNNDIGVPLTLFEVGADTRHAVVEIGTNAPGEIARLTAVAKPDIAVVTCVAEAHLSGLRDIDGVAREKGALVEGLARDGVAVLNGDDPACRAMAERHAGRSVLVRVDREADWFATDVQFNGFGTTFLLQGERPVTLPRMGSHNVYNALFCIAAAVELGVSLEDALARLAALPATSRRLECRRAGDVTVYDDTYNMNPASARAALRALQGLPCAGRRVVVFGEMLELGDLSDELHRALGADVAASDVDLLVTVGDGARRIAEGARAAGLTEARALHTNSAGEALDMLLPWLGRGDIVLCKASRRVALERLVEALVGRLGPPPIVVGASG